ncbi:hypothetical protein [Micromonospora sp. Llam0]|uniref:hypothetical protein n=1 Tax=Micromonospora sp. Llam0 TaxID=2485143 RepID=UPI001F372278|nr:hypothetical protein [Micromonospora sp. Llam0]
MVKRWVANWRLWVILVTSAVRPDGGEVSLDQDRNRTTITLLRIAFVLLAGVSAILGFVGYAELLVGEPGGTTTPVDVLYYTLQLFVLDADQLADRADLPWQLQVARFTAPAATVFALVETARVLLTGELHRLRARRASGHVVVCGDSAMARNLAARLHAADRKVVVVGLPSGTPVPLRRRWYAVPGGPHRRRGAAGGWRGTRRAGVRLHRRQHGQHPRRHHRRHAARRTQRRHASLRPTPRY